MAEQLFETLLALVAGVDTPGSDVELTSAELDVPIEMTTTFVGDELVILAEVPHSRWRSGVLPVVHRARFSVEVVDGGETG